MDLAMNKQIIDHIIEAMNDDSLIVFVGAGVSANSGLPSWNKLINELRTELSLEADEEDNLKVAQFYYDTWGQQKYFQKISDIFGEYMHAEPNEIHEHILKIQPRHIITTNYDTLLEEKLSKGITKYSIIKSDYDIPYTQGNRHLIKMHGDLDRKNIVLKENDYLDYENNFPMMSTLVKSLIMNNTILFIGYSLGDSTFNSIFRLIHNSLGDHTKKSYFYTPNQPREAVMEYYKKKGVHVLSSGKSDILNEDMGESTVEFLSKISSNNKNKKVVDYKELWRNIKFLDKLSFVESRDVVSYINLEKRAYLYTPDRYSYILNDTEKQVFDLPKDSKVNKFLENKTWINNFLGVEIDNIEEIESNSVLQPAFDLYKLNRNNEAKAKFREISNEAYNKQDYLNYMIAEFNVSKILFDRFEENFELAQSIVNAELSEVIDKIIDNSKNDIKKSAIYFRDTILNFNFIYKKMYKINELLDKLKSEYNVVKNGGFSYNNNFGLLKYEFHSFMQFVNKNCICVGHYKEFQMIVNRYFESLLVAFANSNNLNPENDTFSQASSIINAIEMSDVEVLIPYIDFKLLPIYLGNYTFKTIKITEEAFDYIMDRCLMLSGDANGHFDKNVSLLKQYITFLSYVEIQDFDYKKIIDLFCKYPVYYNNRNECRVILSILITQSDNFITEDVPEIVKCINRHIEIILDKKYDLHFVNFYQYRNLLKILKKMDKNVELNIKNIFEEFLIFLKVKEKLRQIEDYEGYLSNFYNYLGKSESNLVNKILTKYSKLPFNGKSYSFIINLIGSGINKFSKIEDDVFSNLIERIKTEETKGIRYYPDKVEVATLELYNLIQQGYLDRDKIRSKEIEERMIGKSPIVDWILFDIRSDELIEKLLKIMNFSKLKEVLCDADEDKKIIDSWAIRHLESGEKDLL